MPKLLNGTLKGPTEIFKILRKIVLELESKEESSKENTHVKC